MSKRHWKIGIVNLSEWDTDTVRIQGCGGATLARGEMKVLAIDGSEIVGLRPGDPLEIPDPIWLGEPQVIVADKPQASSRKWDWSRSEHDSPDAMEALAKLRAFAAHEDLGSEASKTDTDTTLSTSEYQTEE